jgi:hypothetical protein
VVTTASSQLLVLKRIFPPSMRSQDSVPFSAFSKISRVSMAHPGLEIRLRLLQVSKRLGSPYRAGRSPHWLKIKNPAAPAVKREAEDDWGR